jgi:peptidyl-prolyl cis-trans isomerase C
MYRFARTCAAIALALAAASPGRAAEITADTVIAEVNGVKITAGHMIALRQNLPEQYQSLPDEVLYDGLLDQMIQQIVMSGEMGTPTRSEALQIENQEIAMSAGLVVQRVLSGAVTEEGLQAAYDARFAGAAQELEFNASHILVETKEEADAIVAELAAGADFADVARDRSKDPGSGANGGLLGWFGKGMMVKPFEDAVLAAKVGEVTAPVESQFGWHIILVNETRTQALPALDELREELADELRDAAVQEVIAAATAKAQITRTEIEGLDPVFLRNEDLLKE